MSIASMTGFARVNGQTTLDDKTFQWVWEIKSVNGKSLELKSRLPLGFDEMSIALKSKLSTYIDRGSVSVNLEIKKQEANKKVVIDTKLLEELTKWRSC